MPKGRISPGEALRNSGLPLEFAVSSILREVSGLEPQGRYFYEREGVTCETDLEVQQTWKHKVPGREDAVQHIMFLECEHRTNEKHWCFLPPSSSVEKLSENALFLDFIPEVRRLDKSKLRPLRKQYFIESDVVGDGTELYEDGKGQWSSNTQAISNAIRQATMPIGQYLSSTFYSMSMCDWKKMGFIHFFTPVIVTTAKVQVLKEGIGWGELSKCDAIADCFEERASVFSVFVTPTYIANFWRDEMEKTLKSEPQDIVLDFVGLFGDPNDNLTFREIEESVVVGKPTRVLIVEFDSLKDVVARYVGSVKEEINACLDLTKVLESGG